MTYTVPESLVDARNLGLKQTNKQVNNALFHQEGSGVFLVQHLGVGAGVFCNSDEVFCYYKPAGHKYILKLSHFVARRVGTPIQRLDTHKEC